MTLDGSVFNNEDTSFCVLQLYDCLEWELGVLRRLLSAATSLWFMRERSGEHSDEVDKNNEEEEVDGSTQREVGVDVADGRNVDRLWPLSRSVGCTAGDSCKYNECWFAHNPLKKYYRPSSRNCLDLEQNKPFPSLQSNINGTWNSHIFTLSIKLKLYLFVHLSCIKY